MIIGLSVITGLIILFTLGLVSESIFLLFVTAVCGTTYCILLLLDLAQLQKLIRVKLINERSKRYSGSAAFFTTAIENLNDYLLSFSQRLSYQEDEILSSYFRNIAHPTRNTALLSSQESSDMPVVDQLNRLIVNQRARLAAYLCCNTVTGELLCFTSGNQNLRLDSQLKLKYSSFFEQQDYSRVGVFDTQAIQGMTSNFEAYGVRYYCAIPAGETVSGWQGLLWLGFSSDNYPELNQRFEIMENARRLLSLCVNSRIVEELNKKVFDIQERKKNTEQFVTHLSHDLRSPLHNVKTVLALISETEIEERDRQELMQVATRNCAVLEDLVSDILDYNKHSLGELRARKESVNLSNLVRSVKNTFLFTARRKGLELKCQLPAEPVFVNIDQRQISRVLANLLGNSIKFTDQGCVTIALNIEDDLAVLNITDTGTGIDPTRICEVFEPFRRQHEGVPGVGLGLTVCKLMTELNGGRINLHSDGHSGTTASIKLPVESAVSSDNRQAIFA